MKGRVLETPRLILRRFVPEDIPAILAIHRDEAVNRFLPWFPVRTLAEAEQFYQERYAQAESGYSCAICLKSQDTPIGYVQIDAGEAHDLGYGLSRKY